MKTLLPVILAVLFLGATAHADRPVGVRTPPPGGIWLDQVRDASIVWRGGYYLMFRSSYHALHIPVEGFPVSDVEENASARLFFAYGLLGGRADFSVAIDAYGRRFRPEETEGRETPESWDSGDVGDTRLGVRFGLPSPIGGLFLSLEGFMTLDTGNPDKKFSTHSTDAGGIVGFSYHGDSFRTHFQTGYRANRNEEDGVLLYPLFYPNVSEKEDDTANDALILRGGVEFFGPGVDLFVEIFADRHPWTGVTGPRETPTMVTPGVRLHLGNEWFLSASSAISLAADDPLTGMDPETGFPGWTFSLALHYIGVTGGEDRDDDGIDDVYDLCPDEPEDYDGYRDDDGCPDTDNDRDGIPDDWDKAPYDPEDHDGFEDEDGDPDFDNDEDGIPDVEDFCPDEPEDFDGDRDDDGCPDPDTPEGTPEPLENE